ncbi:MAG TPA: M3 family metallopeptidase, partial [Vicinamibacterales bacterium]|nr:M3 family metallopeptidase [Vicinamibacterales bacterium]
YYGDVIDEEPISGLTWARIPHFFSTPYYVYQYATCFASTARLMQDLRSRDAAVREGAVDRYLRLLRAGGSDYPMNLLARAGVDLSQPDTVRAVATELDALVSKLEAELV